MRPKPTRPSEMVPAQLRNVFAVPASAAPGPDHGYAGICACGCGATTEGGYASPAEAIAAMRSRIQIPTPRRTTP